MLELLWLIPTLPFAGFVALTLVGARVSRTGVALIGVGSIGLSAILAALVGLRFLLSPPPGHLYSQTLWRWIEVGGLGAEIGLSLDALSLVMVLVVSWVGFLIHLYSAEFMIGEEGQPLFACMNLSSSDPCDPVLATISSFLPGLRGGSRSYCPGFCIKIR
jgi:NADH-quinone oxidoreductase subunit L